MTRSWRAVDLAVFGLGMALVVFFAGAGAAMALGETPPTAFWAAGGAVSGGLLGLLAPPPGSGKPTGLASRVAGVATQTAAVQRAKAASETLSDDVTAVGEATVNDVRSIAQQTAETVTLGVPEAATLLVAAQHGASTVAQAHQQAAAEAQQALNTADGKLTAAQGQPDNQDVAQAKTEVATAQARFAVLSAAAQGASDSSPSATNEATVAAAAAPAGTPGSVAWALVGIFAGLLTLGLFLAGGAVIPPKQFGSEALQNATKTVITLASAAGAGLIGLFAKPPSSSGST